jgi:hypothetical protein
MRRLLGLAHFSGCANPPVQRIETTYRWDNRKTGERAFREIFTFNEERPFRNFQKMSLLSLKTFLNFQCVQYWATHIPEKPKPYYYPKTYPRPRPTNKEQQTKKQRDQQEQGGQTTNRPTENQKPEARPATETRTNQPSATATLTISQDLQHPPDLLNHQHQQNNENQQQ